MDGRDFKGATALATVHPPRLSVKPNISTYFCAKERTLLSVTLSTPGLWPTTMPSTCLGEGSSCQGTLEPGSHVTPGQASPSGSYQPHFPGFPLGVTNSSPAPQETIFKRTWLKDDCLSCFFMDVKLNLNTKYPLKRKAKKWWYSHTGIACSDHVKNDSSLVKAQICYSLKWGGHKQAG